MEGFIDFQDIIGYLDKDSISLKWKYLFITLWYHIIKLTNGRIWLLSHHHIYEYSSSDTSVFSILANKPKSYLCSPRAGKLYYPCFVDEERVSKNLQYCIHLNPLVFSWIIPVNQEGDVNKKKKVEIKEQMNNTLLQPLNGQI